MRNHSEKLKDICESLLPSKLTDSHKIRQQIHRKTRRRVNTDLGALETDYLPFERRNLRDDAHTEIRYFMYDRRDRDNVSSFIRWATDITKHLETDEEKYSFVERLVPNNLIGRHALTHLPFQRQERRYYYFPPLYDKFGRKIVPPWKPNAEEIAARLRDRIDRPGFHSKLNRAVKDSFRRSWNGHNVFDKDARRRVTIDCTCVKDTRLLMGIHDIDAFAAHYAKYTYNALHPEQRDAVLNMIK